MTLVNQRLASNLKLCIQFHYLDGDVSSAHASPFSAADGRKWTAEKEEGGRGRGLAGLAEVRSRAIHEFGRRAIGERERERKTIRI